MPPFTRTYSTLELEKMASERPRESSLQLDGRRTWKIRRESDSPAPIWAPPSPEPEYLKEMEAATQYPDNYLYVMTDEEEEEEEITYR